MKTLVAQFRDALRASNRLQPLYQVLRRVKWGGLAALALLRSFGFVVRRVVPLVVRQRARPVLFSRRLGAGDIIGTFPAAERLKKRHPRSAFIYNCNSEFHKLPALGGVASVVVSTDVAALKRFWPFAFQAIYEFEWGGDGKNHYVSDEFPIEVFCTQHGLAPTREHPRLTLPPELARRAVDLLAGQPSATGGPLIVFHTGPTWAIREWPHASWCQLITRLQSAGFNNVVQVGASRNAFLGDVQAEVIPGVTSLVDKLGLEETIAIIAQAKLLIGIDSGLLHMAAWVKTPFVGIWGPTNPELRFSSSCIQTPVVSTVPCQGCHHRLPCIHWISGCQNNIACMKEISVDRVFNACLQTLQGSNPANPSPAGSSQNKN